MALFAACVYAAFSQGAIQAPAELHVQVAIALFAALTAGAWLWLGRLRLAAPRLAVAGLLLIWLFGLWSLLSVLWSASPDASWVEANRVFGYLLVLALGVTLGASGLDGTAMVLKGILALATLLVIYALGQKMLPGLHVTGLFNLDQTGQTGRLEQPLGYWNALALLVALGAPAATVLAASPAAFTRRPGPARALRLAGLVVLQLIVVTIGFTESRGGIIAGVVGLGALVALSPDRLRILLWIGAGVGAGLLTLVIALPARPLSGNDIALGRRELAGVYLIVITLAVAVLLFLASEVLARVEERAIGLEADRRRRIWRRIWLFVGALVLLWLISSAVSPLGLSGHLVRLLRSFTEAGGVSTSGAGRLLSANSANRAEWWSQALGAFSARPLAGWGAGSFPVINMLFRRDTLSAADAHSVPLQWLAETGIVGLVLAAGGWILLLRSSLEAVRRAGPAGQLRRSGGELADATQRRLVAAALWGVGIAYTVHALYDWDWDIPGATLPVLIALGALCGAAGLPRRSSVIVVPPEVTRRRALSPGSRLILLTALTLGLCLFAVSAVLPHLASDRASAALIDAGRDGPGQLAKARHEASLATALDPLSDAGPRAQAEIALSEGDEQLARGYLLDAVARNPDDESAWQSLLSVDTDLHNWREAAVSAQRILTLDPELGGTQLVSVAGAAVQANLAQAPPGSSATATATPGP